MCVCAWVQYVSVCFTGESVPWAAEVTGRWCRAVPHIHIHSHLAQHSTDSRGGGEAGKQSILGFAVVHRGGECGGQPGPSPTGLRRLHVPGVSTSGPRGLPVPQRRGAPSVRQAYITGLETRWPAPSSRVCGISFVKFLFPPRHRIAASLRERSLPLNSKMNERAFFHRCFSALPVVATESSQNAAGGR